MDPARWSARIRAQIARESAREGRPAGCVIGAERIPEVLRVEPLLEPFYEDPKDNAP